MGTITQILVIRVLYPEPWKSWDFSMPSNMILKHGACKKLLSYQKSRVVHEVTVIFCHRFLNYRDRTVEQMVQAARLGKQSIVEGSIASGTSREMEVELTNLARASLEELLVDYSDYLSTHGHRIWRKSSPEAIYMRRMTRNLKETEPCILELARSRKAPEVCNLAICLIHQTNFLLDQQIRQSQSSLLTAGTLRGKVYQARGLAR